MAQAAALLRGRHPHQLRVNSTLQTLHDISRVILHFHSRVFPPSALLTFLVWSGLFFAGCLPAFLTSTPWVLEHPLVLATKSSPNCVIFSLERRRRGQDLKLSLDGEPLACSVQIRPPCPG